MHDAIKAYYGETLRSSDDLKTDACATDTHLPGHIKAALAEIHPDVLSRYYGCGLIAPEALDGLSILDLGCGAGRDVFVLSKLVGPEGRVVGVDMTDAQLQAAEQFTDYHRRAFGYAESNVRFLKGYLEELDALDLEPESFDVIVSNCVINLCADKEAVLRSAYRLLKPGGEIYFADVYADRRVPEALRDDPVLHGECLGGALYWNDFLHLAKQSGFLDPRLVEHRPILIKNADIAAKLGEINFYSATCRLFRLADLEPDCEDYGQSVVYKGTIPHYEATFPLDNHHRIPAGEPFPVCGNSYRMLAETRFRAHFEFRGDWQTHLGLFPGCGASLALIREEAGEELANGCC
ncbi:MAG: methyltransferase domain-containing protein [Sphingomonadales bacterium]|nr:methyltransferase domain-containing protein [Sphingomonadales bacterium]